ncbi:hypothetical protein [Halorarum halobium]|uniref:hypothetical protein n=1 Tax=Halorarum halobium TaxID=3075121 RepID=UPI0028A9571C|nr:hypothetical protein [Halobaculum sp. XH14]
MERRTRTSLVALIPFVGAIMLLALTVHPFQYGLVGSPLLVGAFAVLAVVETVLDETSFRTGRPQLNGGVTTFARFSLPRTTTLTVVPGSVSPTGR